MGKASRLLTAAGVGIAVSAAFLIGELDSRAAAGSAGHTYTLRIGDKVVVPAVGQSCSVSAEGGAADLFCERPRGPRHEVTFFRDRILVRKVGDPDRPPVWAGKP